MKAIICAAGEGKRLKPITDNLPKSMVNVGQKSILEHMLDNLSSCGIKETIIITGYREELIKDKIGEEYRGCKIKYYTNLDYQKTDNMFSLWIAKGEIDEGIIFLNGDIIFNKKILEKILEDKLSNAIVVDNQIELVEDSMKVHISNGEVKTIGKKIENPNGWAIGIYKLSIEGAKQYYQEIEKLINEGGKSSSFVKPIGSLLKNYPMNVVNTDGLGWKEIDDLSDLAEARLKINCILDYDN